MVSLSLSYHHLITDLKFWWSFQVFLFHFDFRSVNVSGSSSKVIVTITSKRFITAINSSSSRYHTEYFYWIVGKRPWAGLSTGRRSAIFQLESARQRWGCYRGFVWADESRFKRNQRRWAIFHGDRWRHLPERSSVGWPLATFGLHQPVCRWTKVSHRLVYWIQ